MIKEYEDSSGKKLESDLKLKSTKQDLLPVLDEKKSPVLEDTNTGDATFVDIASLESLAAQSKRTFDAQDYLGKN